jgi:hypothetical protein
MIINNAMDYKGTQLNLKIRWWCFQEINYDSPRGGVSVITEKGDVTTSYLLIQRANTPDSGKYTCNPSNANLKTVVVHVLNGKLCNLLYFLRKRSIMVPICLCSPLYACHPQAPLNKIAEFHETSSWSQSKWKLYSSPYLASSYHCEYQNFWSGTDFITTCRRMLTFCANILYRPIGICETDDLSASKAEVNAWRYTSTSAHIFMAWYIKPRDSSPLPK